MNRRQVIVAGGLVTASAIAFGKGIVATTSPRPPLGTLPSDTPPVVPAISAGALLPIGPLPFEPGQNAGVHISTFWPSEMPSQIARWDFDLQVFDDFTVPQWVYAWQLRRSQGLMMAGNGVRMSFSRDTLLDLTATVRTASGSNAVFSVRLPRAMSMVLTTARQSTGSPPALTDLRYDPLKAELTMADRSPRDFDALLLRTA